MIDDLGAEILANNGEESKLETETHEVLMDYESLYSEMIQTERVALQLATKDFFSKKELEKAQNAGVSFILTKGMDELVRFLEHKLKSGEVASLIFVYQRLKFYCLDGLKALNDNLSKLQNFLQRDEYYRDKKIIAYWELRSKRVQSYGRGATRIIQNLKTLFDEMNIPDSILEIHLDDEDGIVQQELADHLKTVTVELPQSLAALFKLK
jgi:hypothetical protein